MIRERDGSNNPLVSYTRGNDLSGSLEGAGGIGGLLSRSDGYSGGNWTSHNYYHSDGGGNITYMLDGSQAMAASYWYDPFGNLISSSGSLAAANVYRFSSKEQHLNSGMYYYGFRFYEPTSQRWINRDPIGEQGGINLYGPYFQDPINTTDPFGLWNTCGHNSLLNSAFGKHATDGFQLPKNDRKQLKQASRDVDDPRKGGQRPENSYQHGMRAPIQAPSDAREAADNFIADQLQRAINAEQQGDHDRAMYELGKGMHTIADRSAPPHRGEQPWPGLAPIHWPNAALHALRELWPSRRQRNDVVNNLRNHYQQFQDGCSEGDL